MYLNLELLAIQNPWWRGRSLKFDPVIENYTKNKLKWNSEIFSQLDLKRDGIYFLSGARGAGKTTALKLTIKKLIEEDGIKPRQIFYYSCHNLDSAEQLNEMIKLFLDSADKKQRAYIFIDEVSLIKNWRQGINHLIKAGKFKKATVIFSSSFLEKEENEMTFLNMPSLSFSEFVNLANSSFYKKINQHNYAVWGEKIEYYLDIYLLTGGQIGAINDYFSNGAVGQDYYSNFLYWFWAKVSGLGRDQALARQIMEKIILNLGQSVGYKTLAHKTKAKTHLTAAGYLDLFESLLITKTIYQFNGEAPASHKAKKVYFSDPFFFWLFYSHVHGSLDYWRLAREHLHDKNVFGHLLENLVLSQFLKDEKNQITYWRDNIKKQEISFLMKQNKKLTSILIKYDKEIKQADEEIFKNAGFKQGIIISKNSLENRKNLKIVPLSYFLIFYKDLIS